MAFIRFALARRHPHSGVEDGVFSLAYELRDSPNVETADRHLLADTLSCFEKNLQTPTRFNRTKSKGFYRRKTRGIAWFKDTSTEHLARMHQIKGVLESYGHSVVMLSESRVGYVTYEMPFRSSPSPSRILKQADWRPVWDGSVSGSSRTLRRGHATGRNRGRRLPSVPRRPLVVIVALASLA